MVDGDRGRWQEIAGNRGVFDVIERARENPGWAREGSRDGLAHFVFIGAVPFCLCRAFRCIDPKGKWEKCRNVGNTGPKQPRGVRRVG